MFHSIGASKTDDLALEKDFLLALFSFCEFFRKMSKTQSFGVPSMRPVGVSQKSGTAVIDRDFLSSVDFGNSNQPEIFSP